MHGHQANLTALRYLIDRVFQNGNDIYAFVQKNAPCLISMITLKGGHVILAYQTEDLGSEKRIWVYDSNRSWGGNKAWYDKHENFMKIDSNGGWDFDFSGGGQPHWTTGIITAFPLSVMAPRDRSPASLGLGVTAILGKVHFSGAPASLDQVTDGEGKRLFRPGTKELERDPKLGMLSAIPLYQLDGVPAAGGSGGGEIYFFLDPRSGPFDFQVRGEQGYELLLATQTGQLRVRGQGAGGVDHVQVVDPASREPSVVLFNAIGSSSLEAEIAESPSPRGKWRDFKLSSLSMPRGGLVSLKLAREQDRVQVESPLHGVSFDLTVSQTDGAATASVERQGVALAAGAKALLGPSDWSDLAQSVVRVVTSTLSTSEVESRCAQLYGPGGGPVGADFSSSRDIGGGTRGSTVFDSRSGVYAQVSSGSAIGPGGDSFQFAYTPVQGDFEFTAEVVERIDPPVPSARLGRHGLMARRDCTPASRFSQLQTMTGGDIKDWPRWAFRPVHGDSRSGDDRQQFSYDPDPLPGFLKMVRRGNTFYGFLSRDGQKWDPVGSDTWYDQAGPVLVGFASTSGLDSGGVPSTIRFKVLGLGPIESALLLPLPLLPLPEAGGSAGERVYQSTFEGPEGSPPAGFSVGERAGGFLPSLHQDRLRLTDEAFPGSAVSALSVRPLEGIDSWIYQFDFDLHLGRSPGGDPGEGLTVGVGNL